MLTKKIRPKQRISAMKQLIINPIQTFNYKPIHSCPSCQCFNLKQPSPLTTIYQQSYTDHCYRCDRFFNIYARESYIVKGQNVQRDRITLARSMSPYVKKITFRFLSPSNINNKQNIYKNLQRITPKKHSIIKQLNNQSFQTNRPKILDRKKTVQSIKNLRISFKTVKSAKSAASTKLFIETPSKQTKQNNLSTSNKQKIQNKLSGDENQTSIRSMKSLSKISIDEKFFQK